MKKTWREIQISRCIKLGNKYKWFKFLMLMEIILIICTDRAVKYMNRNRKRFLGVGLTVLVFLVSNSFSTPMFQEQSLEQAVQSGEGIALEAAAPEQITEFSQEILSAEETDYYHEEIDDQYSVDEILNDSHSQELLNQYDFSSQEQGQFSKEDWNLILVNKQHPIPEDYTFELGTIAASMQCDARIIPELYAMLQAAREEGINLIICSPYRDISRQTMLFNRKIQLHMDQGDNYMDAYKKASQIVTVPGASEHQVGLALDIISDTYTILDEGFGDTTAGKWLQQHSKEYGFILRYPEGKEYITGIDYEPWHFRYVGKEAAIIIMDNGLTLEEFVESISG